MSGVFDNTRDRIISAVRLSVQCRIHRAERRSMQSVQCRELQGERRIWSVRHVSSGVKHHDDGKHNGVGLYVRCGVCRKVGGNLQSVCYRELQGCVGVDVVLAMFSQLQHSIRGDDECNSMQVRSRIHWARRRHVHQVRHRQVQGRIWLSRVYTVSEQHACREHGSVECIRMQVRTRLHARCRRCEQVFRVQRRDIQVGNRVRQLHRVSGVSIN